VTSAAAVSSQLVSIPRITRPSTDISRCQTQTTFRLHTGI
jgi:hypothetical protein